MTTRYSLWSFAKQGVVALLELEVVGPAPKGEAIQAHPKVIGIAPLWSNTNLQAAWKKANAFFTRKHGRPMSIKVDHTRETIDETIHDLGLREASYLVQFQKTMAEKLTGVAEHHKAKMDAINQVLAQYEEACTAVRDLKAEKFVTVG